MALGFNSSILYTGSMGASFVTDPIYLPTQTGFCVHAIFTDASAPVGSFTIETSIDGSTWATLADSTQAISAAGDHFYSISRVSYPMARLKWTRTSGSGDITVHAFAKGQ